MGEREPLRVPRITAEDLALIPADPAAANVARRLAGAYGCPPPVAVAIHRQARSGRWRETCGLN